MPDGALPNAKIRETVLRLLHQLPVDCSLEDRKEQLKRSGLGKVVMFLFKVPGALRCAAVGGWWGGRLGRGFRLGWGRGREGERCGTCAEFCGFCGCLVLLLTTPPCTHPACLQMRPPATASWPRSWWSDGAGPYWRPTACGAWMTRCACLAAALCCRWRQLVVEVLGGASAGLQKCHSV